MKGYEKEMCELYIKYLEDEEVYHCQLCDEKFKVQVDAYSHLEIHSGIMNNDEEAAVNNEEGVNDTNCTETFETEVSTKPSYEEENDKSMIEISVEVPEVENSENSNVQAKVKCNDLKNGMKQVGVQIFTFENWFLNVHFVHRLKNESFIKSFSMSESSSSKGFITKKFFYCFKKRSSKITLPGPIWINVVY